MRKLGTAREELAAQLELVERERAVRHFKRFVRYMWREIEPLELDESWYIDVICDHLEALTFGRHPTRKALINVPPRHIKTKLVSVLWPAWEWLHDPSLRYVTASYDYDLATRDAVDSRRLMQSMRYQALKAHIGAAWVAGLPYEFTSDQNVKTRFENNAGGSRVVVSVGSKVTGFGGERLIGDDLHNVLDGDKPNELRKVREWYDQAFRNRVNDERTAVRVIVGQRVAEDDISGHLLETDRDFDHICLPFRHEVGRKIRPTRLGFVDPRTVDGEPLVPERWGPREIATTRPGSRYYDTQYQQRPRAQEGSIFKRVDFKRWSIEPPRFDMLALSTDMNFGRTEKQQIELVNDPNLSHVVIQVWGHVGPDSYLLDEDRGQWDFKRALDRVLVVIERHPRATRRTFEAKANGPAIMSLLREAIPGCDPYEPEGSKIQRAYACQPFVESGNVWIPVGQQWEEWLDELEAFPNGRFDDRVDAMTQELLRQYVNEGMGDPVARIRRLIAK